MSFATGLTPLGGPDRRASEPNGHGNAPKSIVGMETSLSEPELPADTPIQSLRHRILAFLGPYRRSSPRGPTCKDGTALRFLVQAPRTPLLGRENGAARCSSIVRWKTPTPRTSSEPPSSAPHSRADPARHSSVLHTP